jgi:guanylate kinase
MKGILFIISSPSGGGKGTLTQAILREISNIGYSISFTTRRIRQGEENGREYFFVDENEFEKLVQRGELLEYANVHGKLYGTSKSRVESELRVGRDIILDIDVQGAASIKKVLPDSVSVFVVPPSFEILKERLRARGTETDAEIEVRLLNAKKEVTHFREFDYVIVNRDLETAVTELKSIIFAERVRGNRRSEMLEAIYKTFI